MPSPLMPWMTRRRTGGDSDDAAGLLESLFDMLEGCSPEDYYFGAHPGDGSDYGFWKMDKDK